MNQRTLIIEKPASIPWRRRFLAVLITLAAWALLSLTWLPILRELLALAGLHVAVPGIVRGAILSAFPIGSRIGIALIALSLVSILGRQLWDIRSESRPYSGHCAAPVTLGQLAAVASTSEPCLTQWQAARTLYVEHDDHGQIRNVRPGVNGSGEVPTDHG
ncbi:poly-beta-1,6-N-acetyl-D-glucosamine biosynthesis protein PgaD [Dyella silvae]|uniref:poly-beta-1,6-N-acetyl-D-glucosamine biosynthesis protein PgaD n=1 Tax=Dyella silvae TaxID=2994424 RepID=UPI002264BC73|nr:poly-beta-1,6-N-acetyl-D-glucosamine biosynthesis protein PgaD [Dyella silvae]